MSTPLFPQLTLEALRQGYANGRTPQDVVRECYARIQQRGADGVWTHVPPLEELLALAAEVATDPSLPLYGVPFAIKDNLDVAGWPTSAACPAFAYTPTQDATVVARLKAAGAIPMGKANMDQFATGLVGTRSPYGIPHSIYSEAHLSGGSSSGSGVSVAAGLVAFSLGTDTAGSGRVPAGFNGIVGIKPSCGLLSTRGVVPACRSLDCVSIFAPNVADAHAVLRVAEGFDAEDAYSLDLPKKSLPLEKPKVGVLKSADREFFGDTLAEKAYADAIAHAASLGWEIVECDFAPFRDMAIQLYAGAWVAERLAAIEPFMKDHANEMDPTVRAIIGGAEGLTAVAAYRGVYERQRLIRVASGAWKDMDIMLLPTTPSHYTVEEVLADPIRLNSRLGTYTNFVNLLNMCAIAIPAGMRPDGLPFGITLMAPAGADDALAILSAKFCGEPIPATVPNGLIPLVVVGAHLKGQPLHKQLAERDAPLLWSGRTKPGYRLYALANTTPPKPGLVRDTSFAGQGIEVEVYGVTPTHLGTFMTLVGPPLAIGNVELSDGRWVKGFVCEPSALDGSLEITEHGGWRAWLAQK